MEIPTWKNTIHNHGNHANHISELAGFANAVGYKYILWNDQIFKIKKADGRMHWQETGLTIHDMNEITFNGSIIIACRAAGGEPVMVIYEVSYTNEEYDLGAHYARAIALAQDDGYEGPFICFDENEKSEITAMADILNGNLTVEA